MSLGNRWKRALAAVMLASAFAACSSSKEGFAEAPRLLDGDDGGDSAAAPACEGRRCSRDLHSVIDGCTDRVVESCSDDSGCAAGACVSACASAAASQGSIGCSFWTIPPDTAPNGMTSCFAAFVANTWSTPVTVTGEYGHTVLDISKSIYRAEADAEGHVSYELLTGAIPPGEVGIVFLAQGDKTPGDDDYIACPAGVNVAFHGTVIREHRTSIYDAFHLTTNAPVSAYSIFPYGGAKSYIPSATLLIPSASWDTNYFLIDGWKANLTSPFVQIVAEEDDTEIRMRPTVEVRNGPGVAGAARGFVGTWKLNRGQVLELSQRESLAGSPIQTSRPVALFGGSPCTNIPDLAGACDALHQQIAPVHQWASRYSAVPYKSRRVGLQGGPETPENVIWKMVAARDGTTLTYDPERPLDAPTKLAAGEIVMFTSDAPFTVKSQSNDYPIYVAVYMTGATQYSTAGDPDLVNIVPDEQFLDRYVFFVDHTYAESTLTFVRRKDASGFHDVELDCLGTVTGWRPLGHDESIEYAWVDLTHNRKGVTTAKGTCSYGRHEASSEGAFGLYVWGEDFCASYGFPAGAGSRPTSSYSVDLR